MIERRVIIVHGIVQGVGFRPHVYRLATMHGLDGSVCNEHEGVLIDVQGSTVALDGFLSALTAVPPPLAVISHVRVTPAETASCSGFRIAERAPDPSDGSATTGSAARLTLIPPDSATCDECLAELFDPADRRFLYPFLNCTNCGPRLTIVCDLPYDRARTTMAGFPMCVACHAEYTNPADRRFHAQPTACAECGPSVRLHWPDHQETRGALKDEADAGDPIAVAAQALSSGLIVAIKGLGGYHIACDATDPAAIERLRMRKHREDKPFAVMVPDVEAAAAFCGLTMEERALLNSRERPIVLLEKRNDLGPSAQKALDVIAPRNGSVGVMLPYTPLHHLLLASVARPLVMTSGNLTDEPITFEDDDARDRLLPLVDLLLTHNRPIATRCDDSVMRMVNQSPTFIRRSRGFVPRPINVALPFAAHVLAVGGQLKNTFCLARECSAFLSHHIGDLENAAAYRALEQGISRYSALVGVRPQIVVHDLHPGYMSTQIAERMALAGRLAVQHHHAHIASCMAEHGLTDPVIGVAFDGTGLGDDGAIWGGEFLVVDAAGYRRIAHLGYVPLPGGDAAIRRPLRMALSHLWAAFGPGLTSLPLALLRRAGSQELDLVQQMLAKGVNSPPTSSVGRLFDAVASLIGLRDTASFEGQAAMELEAAADPAVTRSYGFAYEFSSKNEASPISVIDAAPVIHSIVDDMAAGRGVPEIAAAFHNSLVRMIVDVAQQIRASTGINCVALSGGVFQNVLLATRAVDALETAGFDVFTQRLVPCNDGGLSLGQAYTVALRSASEQLQLCADTLPARSPASGDVALLVRDHSAGEEQCA